MTKDELERKLNAAYEEANKRAEAIDRNGGSTEEIREAQARADAFSEALGWAEQFMTAQAAELRRLRVLVAMFEFPFESFEFADGQGGFDDPNTRAYLAYAANHAVGIIDDLEADLHAAHKREAAKDARIAELEARVRELENDDLYTIRSEKAELEAEVGRLRLPIAKWLDVKLAQVECERNVLQKAIDDASAAYEALAESRDSLQRQLEQARVTAPSPST